MAFTFAPCVRLVLMFALLTFTLHSKHSFVIIKKTKQYGSTVYIRRDCHGWSSIIAIHKEILVFTFSFNLNLSSKDIKLENM